MQEELEELDKTDKVSAALQEYVSEKLRQLDYYSMVLVLEKHV
jgi:ribosome assembly protein YihI (activator of Der GTPase)